MANVNGHHEVREFTNGTSDKSLKNGVSSEGNAGGSYVPTFVDGSVPGPSHNFFNGIP